MFSIDQKSKIWSQLSTEFSADKLREEEKPYL